MRINLTVFYSSLGEQSESQRKTALVQFFAKGVVGYLARANRKYISDNPAREKVFLQLLKHLRELFLLDLQSATLSSCIKSKTLR